MSLRRLLLGVYAICFAIGTFTHAQHIWHYGFLPYRFAPLPTNIFWTALTLIDPLVILLFLLRRRRSALSLALAIMVSDVAVNSYAVFGSGYGEFAPALALQSAFLGFVLGSIGFLWADPPLSVRTAPPPRGSCG
ncbi:hypothetical protein [Novosphingopyxis sp.]|uniref:hypothetical protein n=1 Tax=Novosphingopyxis sp. TaxID=2709690 RepID=UPI003B5A1B4B